MAKLTQKKAALTADRVQVYPDADGVYAVANPTEAGKILVSDGTKWVAGDAGGGGLDYFEEALGSGGPKIPFPTSALLANLDGEANIGAALVPKGNGWLAAAVPDNTEDGGGTRGQGAVDWQLMRSAAEEVAAGTAATLSGGVNNKALGNYSAGGGGSGNVMSGDFSSCPGGGLNDISGLAANGAGWENVVSGDYSCVPGGKDADTLEVYGMEAFASGLFAAPGDAQTGRLVTRASLSGAPTEDPVVLTSDAGAVSPFNILPVQQGTAVNFRMQATLVIGANGAVIPRGALATTVIQGVARNVTGTVEIVANETHWTHDDGLSAALPIMALVADSANGGIYFHVQASETMNLNATAFWTFSTVSIPA